MTRWLATVTNVYCNSQTSPHPHQFSGSCTKCFYGPIKHYFIENKNTLYILYVYVTVIVFKT